MSEPSAATPDGGPRTFEHGPSDPVTLADGPGTWVELEVAAPVEVVWGLVTDIDLPSQFSPEYLGGRWTGDGPALGASFIGRNRHERVGEWEVESFVDVYEPQRAFGWATVDRDDPGSRWRFRLSPTTAGTLLRYELILGPGPSGLTPAIAAMPDKEAQILDRRLAEHHANMVSTVAGIGRLAESAGSTTG